MASLTSNELAAIKKQLDAKFRTIVSQGIAPPLLARGFRRKGFRFMKPIAARIIWVVDFDHSTWTERGEKAFSLQFGAFVPGFHDVSAFRRDPNDPKARERLSGAGCPLPGLLGHVGDDPHPPWLEFYVDASDDEIRGLSQHMRMRVETYVLPWLERFRTLNDVVRALKRPPEMKKKQSEVTYHTLMDDRYRAAAAVEFVAGEHEAALKTVKSAFAQWPRRRRPEFLSEFNDHLVSMIEAVRRKDTGVGKAD
jgi:hypothetical protein